MHFRNGIGVKDSTINGQQRNGTMDQYIPL